MAIINDIVPFQIKIEEKNSVFTDATNVSRELSLHPVHLTPDKGGNLPPSALIPYCSYQGENSLLGKELPELNNLTVCGKFHRTILEGQVCHTLDLEKLNKRKHPTKSGKSNGLFLLLDPNPYQLGDANDKEEDKHRMGDDAPAVTRTEVKNHTSSKALHSKT